VKTVGESIGGFEMSLRGAAGRVGRLFSETVSRPRRRSNLIAISSEIGDCHAANERRLAMTYISTSSPSDPCLPNPSARRRQRPASGPRDAACLRCYSRDFHRVFTDHQFFSDLTVRHAIGDQAQHIQLTFGQFSNSGCSSLLSLRMFCRTRAATSGCSVTSFCAAR